MWHEKWPLDTILDALKEAYDPQRFDLGHEKWYKWIRDNKPHLEVDYLRLEEFREAYTHKLNEARIKFGEPPAQHHKDILKELQGMLTATGNIHRRESANMEFQEALNKACLADSEYLRSPSVKSLAKSARLRPEPTSSRSRLCRRRSFLYFCSCQSRIRALEIFAKDFTLGDRWYSESAKHALFSASWNSMLALSRRWMLPVAVSIPCNSLRMSLWCGAGGFPNIIL